MPSTMCRRYCLSCCWPFVPGKPRFAGTRLSPFCILLELRMMEVVVMTGAVRQTVTNNKPTHSFLQAGYPSCRSTSNVRSLKGKYYNPWTCAPQAHLGSFSHWPLAAAGYLWEGLPRFSLALWRQWQKHDAINHVQTVLRLLLQSAVVSVRLSHSGNVLKCLNSKHSVILFHYFEAQSF